MITYREDKYGKWEREGLIETLIEPSDYYHKEKEREQQQRIEQELLNSLKPSQKEVLMAEVEINTISLLLESGVI